MTAFTETAAVKAAGIDAGHPLAGMLEGRADILAMTEQAHDAALTPQEPGGLSHGERAALACRMARLIAADSLAAHFETLMTRAGADAATTSMADPAFDGGDARSAALVRHTDLVTSDTKSVVADDIAALTAAGVSEDDVVRLSELISFVNYQARLAFGLKLMGALS